MKQSGFHGALVASQSPKEIATATTLIGLDTVVKATNATSSGFNITLPNISETLATPYAIFNATTSGDPVTVISAGDVQTTVSAVLEAGEAIVLFPVGDYGWIELSANHAAGDTPTLGATRT